MLFTAFAAVSDVRAAPEPGRYEGILRVTKTLPFYTNTLSVTATVRVVAQVIQDGSERQLTILAAVAEPPIAAFDTEKSVIRLVKFFTALSSQFAPALRQAHDSVWATVFLLRHNCAQGGRTISKQR